MKLHRPGFSLFWSIFDENWKSLVFTSVDKSLKRCRHLLFKSFCFTFRFFFSLLVKFAKRKWFSFFPVGQEFIGIESLYWIKSKVIHLIWTSNKNITLTHQQLKHRNYVCVTLYATLQHTTTCARSIISLSLLLRNMSKALVLLLLLQYSTSSAAGRRFLTLGTFSWGNCAVLLDFVQMRGGRGRALPKFFVTFSQTIF